MYNLCMLSYTSCFSENYEGVCVNFEYLNEHNIYSKSILPTFDN